jgi:hypothetical protein
MKIEVRTSSSSDRTTSTVLTLETRSIGSSRQASTNSLDVSSAALTQFADALGNSASRRRHFPFVPRTNRYCALPFNFGDALGPTVGVLLLVETSA